MRMFNLNRQPIRGCMKMNYKGFEISVSNVFSPNEIAIFEHEGRGPMLKNIDGLTYQLPATVEGFLEAVAIIDGLTS